nr:hypothetical protein [Candidatus Cloacimonadota bacterium]
MNNRFLIFALLTILIVLVGCTKKDNLTGTNWSEIEMQTFEDASCIIGGYSFPADSLISISSGRKNLLVGNWQGSNAKSILRFTNLPADSTLARYHEIRELYLDLILQRSSKIEQGPVTLNFYKVLSGWTANPDTLTFEDYVHIPQATTVINTQITSSDTLSIPLPYSLIQNWQADADSTGLNILIMADDAIDGFVEIKLSTANDGSKLRFQYKEYPSDDSFKDFSRYAVLNAYSFSHPEVEPALGQWRLSNFAPQRIYVDLQPDFAMFKDQYGQTLEGDDLKRVSINSAELVLFIKDDLPNFTNTFSYNVSAFLLKERPEDGSIIPTLNMYTPEFISNLVNIANIESDSLVVNITPIIQAYVSEKTFADDTVVEPNGIVIMSNYERKDFGEIEFYHPITDADAPQEKQAYIRIKYTPPYL